MLGLYVFTPIDSPVPNAVHHTSRCFALRSCPAVDIPALIACHSVNIY